jgi:hypothetical protein
MESVREIGTSTNRNTLANMEDAVKFLSNKVKNQIGAKSKKWSKEEWRDVDRIIKASVAPILEEETSPEEVAKILKSIKSGYGCWLDPVEMALKKAIKDVPDPGKEEFSQIFGAFKMAQLYLFDIERNHYALANIKSNGSASGRRI